MLPSGNNFTCIAATSGIVRFTQNKMDEVRDFSPHLRTSSTIKKSSIPHVSGSMDVTCFNCGELYAVKIDGSTEHRCSEKPSATMAGWNELLSQLNTRSHQPSNTRTAVGKPNQNKPKSKMVQPNNFDLAAINAALGLDKNGHGVMSLNNPNNMFPSFLDQSPTSSANLAAMQRQAPSPIVGQQQANNANGSGGMNGMNVGMPMNAGSQMDYNLLYQKVMELAQVLQENREQTKDIVASAEELAVSHDLSLRYDRETTCENAIVST